MNSAISLLTALGAFSPPRVATGRILKRWGSLKEPASKYAPHQGTEERMRRLYADELRGNR